MNPEERKTLYETAELVQENNNILRGMRRSARFAVIWKIFYWALILGFAYQGYVMVQPYLNAMIQTYTEMQKNLQSIKDVGSKIPTLPSSITNILKK
ncbi:MAG: hypothetical protein WCO10_02655 [bacterium]